MLVKNCWAQWSFHALNSTCQMSFISGSSFILFHLFTDEASHIILMERSSTASDPKPTYAMVFGKKLYCIGSQATLSNGLTATGTILITVLVNFGRVALQLTGEMANAGQ
jgi:hypothetical protein